MPYRVDLRHVEDDAFERLAELGALDIECSRDGSVAALLPDGVSPERLAATLGAACIVSPARGRDAESVWVLEPRPIRVGGLRIVPAHLEDAAGELRLLDGPAFGTGMHPTTALCLEALQDALQPSVPHAVLDVGTGSGVLALGALMLGVPHAVGLDLDAEALQAAAENARLNGLSERLRLVPGGPDAIDGTWPLVLANVLAGPLIDMAPTLVRRVGRGGRLVLSGIPSSVEPDVDRAYRHVGMQRVRTATSAGWVVLVMRASW